ncbi:hypothetical protein PtrSN002B_004495 [Pyrenophora tritici-repentis]|uniref:Tymo-45kd-70kd multi-domain protein n=2 Tax=Pyrenophora tritici-repentis TaxID=45151 RepID=A0A2W1EJE8_9PLEO|nr:uncharacterized protein PTRG_06614 [Pyrenophora tritici-repentis Pt-1C-BFP]KAA8613711.1 hypothetical protein PtrV1_12619 [Pyrenophora tritici-repentis]EDU49534.1 predicted protein [Pyrenophora tritici-repentis Pt-1C-BFP]KAF7445432.1 hypothetical protein A1F99_104180 [Pyrenophora tritici-repentis]KAF7565700.1 Tymo-45kd-70kd multi-domain protein [Pyrenophora tritici-repentis]KAG9380189.1 hypothetical protein A1F94_009084 [Pyrenophora tritici-repentis]
MADTTSKMKKPKDPGTEEHKDNSPLSDPATSATSTKTFHATPDPRESLHLPLFLVLPIIYTLLHLLIMPSPRPLLSRTFLLPLFTIIIASSLADVHWTHKLCILAVNKRIGEALNRRAAVYEETSEFTKRAVEKLDEVKTAYTRDWIKLCRYQSSAELAVLRCTTTSLEDMVRLLRVLGDKEGGGSGGKGSGDGCGKHRNRTGGGVKKSKGDTGTAMALSNADQIAATEERIKELKKDIVIAEKVEALYEREDLEIEEIRLLVEKEEEKIRTVDKEDKKLKVQLPTLDMRTHTTVEKLMRSKGVQEALDKQYEELDTFLQGFANTSGFIGEEEDMYDGLSFEELNNV